jgi:hypothetical protein
MAVKLSNVIPFGRSLHEYQALFNLSKSDLERQILGVADGPASFNAEATALGKQVTSIDPLYELNGAEILQRFNDVVDDVIQQVKATPGDWVWSYHHSPEDLRNNRVQAIHRFLEDYELGKAQNRYQIGTLPKLNLLDNSYDLVLCSHFLFLYSEHYDFDFHLASIQEMLRVGQEVRIFPLVTLMLNRSPYLDAIVQSLREMNYSVTIQATTYELQKGGNELLRICR